jgi:UDP-N-acetylmuramoyl-tripeptide--D-alanyl-D-alanine ligase
VIFFGFGNTAEVRASELSFLGYDGIRFVLTYDGVSREIRLPFLTEGLVQNLLAALGAARAFGLPWEALEPALSRLSPASHRGRILRLAGDLAVIDDAYNSSPQALAMALKSYVHLPASRRVAVLGDMLELGSEEKTYHREAGRAAGKLGWNVVVAVGLRARWIVEGAREAGLPETAIREFATSEEAAGAIPGIVRPGDLVLVKGSRGVRMERVVESLSAAFKES